MSAKNFCFEQFDRWKKQKQTKFVENNNLFLIHILFFPAMSTIIFFKLF